MKNPVFDQRHLVEYVVYGLIAGLMYVIPVWIYLFEAKYVLSWFAFLGNILFMFAIMGYCIKLSRRRSDYSSTWIMIVSAHCVIFVGIVFSVIFSAILCFVYIPAFMTGHSPTNFLQNSPTGFNIHNTSTIVMIFLTATFANFGAGSFTAILCPYVFKPNQTKDEAIAVKPGV